MELENDIAIRRCARHILSDNVAIGVGDGWHQLVGRTLLEIQDTTDVKVAMRQIKERSGKLAIFTDVVIRAVPATVMQRVFDFTKAAEDQSAFICEMCSSSGRMMTEGCLRVRCQACKADDTGREGVWREQRIDILEAAEDYIRVSLEHLFPVANISLPGGLDSRDQRLFLEEVHDRLVWFRAGARIEGWTRRFATI